MLIAAAYAAPEVYNILVTFITGGVPMVIFFFVFKLMKNHVKNGGTSLSKKYH